MAAKKKVEALTPEQELRLVEWRAEWLSVGTCTDPADRHRAEKAIGRMYGEIGKPAPTFIWVDSPLTANILIYLLREKLGKVLDDPSPRDSLWVSLRASLGASLGASLRDSLRDSLWASLWASLRDSLRDSLWASLRDSLRDSLGASLRASLGASLGASLRDSLRDSLRASLGVSLRDSLGASLRASLGASLRDSLWASLWASLRDSLGASLRASLRASKIPLSDTYWWGQMDSYWVAYYAFMREIGVRYDDASNSRLRLHEEVCRGCGWWWPFDGVCVVSERPLTVHMNAAGRLHNDTGMAVQFRDGWGVYAVQGIRVPGDIIEDRASLTVKRIKDENNAELRRVMIDLYGMDRYLDDSGLKPIHTDDWGELYQESSRGDGQPFTAVRVVNGTPEPDGTYKRYLLPVHPELCPLFGGGRFGERQQKTALNAVASTYGMTGQQYKDGFVARR